ncbi:MAG TPA: hypothetical protein VGQ41_20545 [Pyrinomonadaceae bacterium]|jgi:hypothetical protein|nr:hypothetical protein [Pyrinomonadaceae bacterium]
MSARERLPVYRWHNPELDYCEGWPIAMEFRLIYDGPLKASSRRNSRVKDKHRIRKQLHPQLAALWNQHPMLNYMKTEVHPENHALRSMRAEGGWFADPDTTIMETFARRFSRCGYRFVPLVNAEYSLVCGLDVLFLRRQNPGDLIGNRGDIDNRIKTFFDALRIPTDGGELPRDSVPDIGEDPFFCLVQDDSLITEVRIVTDRLLRPLKNREEREISTLMAEDDNEVVDHNDVEDDHETETMSNVVLLVHVTVKASDVSSKNLPLL